MPIEDRYTREMGMHFDYTPGPVALPAGVAPAAGNQWLGVPGAMQPALFTVTNEDFDGIDLMAFSTGPFLVQIKVATVYISSDYVHGYSVFGTQSGMPQRLLIPIRMRENDTITFQLQDISWQQNLVYITVRGVQLKDQR